MTPEQEARLAELRVVPGASLGDTDLPSVAVIVPSLDGLHRLKECLPSVHASRYPAELLQVVVIDNGSSDGTSQAVSRSWPRVRVLRNERNLGFTRACNQGARAAAGVDILAFVNNDVRVEPDWLRELVGPIARGECDSTGAKMLFPDGRLEYAGGGSSFQGFTIGHTFGDERDPREDVPRRALFACGGAMAVRTEAFTDVGGFDEDYFAYYDDLDLGWRLWLSGREVHYAPAALCTHRRSDTSRTFPREQIRLLQVRNALLTCFKNYGQESLDRVLPALLALACRRTWIMAHCPGDSAFRIESGHRRGGLRGLVGRVLGRRGSRLSLPPLAAADFLAVNDWLGDWDRWAQRRGEVQANRRRGDAEILRLFLDPLWCVETEPGYRALQSALVAQLGIDGIFD